MATLADQDIADLATGTLERLGRLRFQQIAQSIQNYEVLSRMLKKDKVQFDDGIGVQRTIMVDHGSAAKQVGLYETDNVNVPDLLQTMEIPWRHSTTNYAFERREMLMNRGTSRIVDLLQVRRTGAMISLAELMEEQFWAKPATSTDKLDVYGVPYWIVYNATEGFNGGNPYSGVGPGGLDRDTYSEWKNYSGQYTNITKADLVTKLRTAYRKIRFKSPVDVPDFRTGNGDQYRLYTNETVLQGLEDLGEAQNENLGRDIASMDGVLTFRRNPIIWVPKLDANDTVTDPVYMLNYAYFAPVFLRGDYLRESEPKQAPSQHNVWQVHVDLTWNVLCVDCRRQAVLAKS